VALLSVQVAGRDREIVGLVIEDPAADGVADPEARRAVLDLTPYASRGERAASANRSPALTGELPSARQGWMVETARQGWMVETESAGRVLDPARDR